MSHTKFYMVQITYIQFSQSFDTLTTDFMSIICHSLMIFDYMTNQIDLGICRMTPYSGKAFLSNMLSKFGTACFMI